MSNTCRLDSLLTPEPRSMGFSEAIQWMIGNQPKSLACDGGKVFGNCRVRVIRGVLQWTFRHD